MERLTKKISKTVQDKYSLGSYLQYDFASGDDTNKLLNKLGAFEDFMEKNKCNSLMDLQADLTILSVTKSILKLTEQENQILKDRWKKLGKWCADHGFSDGWNSTIWDEAICAVVNEMKRLENEVNNDL